MSEQGRAYTAAQARYAADNLDTWCEEEERSARKRGERVDVTEERIEAATFRAYADMKEAMEREWSDSSVIYATVRDALNGDEDELHIECRFANGEKIAAVVVDGEHDDLAHFIADMLNLRSRSLPQTEGEE